MSVVLPDLPPHLTVVATTRESSVEDRWSLALLALGIPFEVARVPDTGERALVVRIDDADRARHTITDVETEQEQRAREVAEEARPVKIPRTAYIWAELLAAGLVVMGAIAGPRGGGGEWMERGFMDAEAVLTGAWHRLFTGVTLHADGAHLASNVLFLMVVAPTVIFRMGPGVAMLSLFVTGAVGNAVTSGFHGANFSNVGASGGVFGLACILGILAARTRKSRLGANRWILGVGAALGLLSMLAFGERADVVAHLAGFAAGAPFGLLFPVRPVDSQPRWWIPYQLAMGVLAVGIVGWAWWRAWQ